MREIRKDLYLFSVSSWFVNCQWEYYCECYALVEVCCEKCYARVEVCCEEVSIKVFRFEFSRVSFLPQVMWAVALIKHAR